MKQPKFNIGDRIYHNTPNSEEGLVMDISYSLRYKEFVYNIVVGYNNNYDCLEDELTEDKIF
jgi:hypothetical protein